MITEKEASKQLARMAGMNFFPRSASPEDAAALLELRQAMQTADTPEIAKTVTDDWLANNTQRPTPADLRTLIFEKNAPKLIANPDCRQCSGTGVRIVTRLSWIDWGTDANGAPAPIKRVERTVADERVGWLEADSMEPRAQAYVFTAGEDCGCKAVASKPTSSSDPRESKLQRVEVSK